MKTNRNTFAHKDYSGQTLENYEFVNCILDDVSFKHATLINAKFTNCRGEGLLFTSAKLKGVKIENCSFTFSDFEHADLSESDIVTLDLSYSALTGCIFDYSSIDNLTVTGCAMNMVSFIDAKMKSVTYEPVLPMGGPMRGISPFVPGKMRHNHVFLNGNDHLAFAGYWRHEATVERLFSLVEEDRNRVRRPFKVAALWLFYQTSDFGYSFFRWLMLLFGIVVLFAALYFFHLHTDVILSFKISLHSFFSLDMDIITKQSCWFFLAESITGYLMLGVLVSMLTNKIISA